MTAYERRYIEPTQKYPAILPHSEVCMRMGVAGRIMFIEWDGKRSVQLYRVECHGNGWNADDKFVPFSAPILLGEAGVYTDERGKPYQVTELTSLDYLREAKRSLTPEQERICDDFVIGILALHVPEQVWKDAVDMAVRLARREEP